MADEWIVVRRPVGLRRQRHVRIPVALEPCLAGLDNSALIKRRHDSVFGKILASVSPTFDSNRSTSLGVEQPGGIAPPTPSQNRTVRLASRARGGVQRARSTKQDR